MKKHSSEYKNIIKKMGRQLDSKITFGSTVLGKNDLNAVTPSYQGAILKSVMKQLDIDSNVAIPIGTILKYEFGLKVNGEYEYINYGNYIVYSIEKQEDTKSYKIVCYDKLLYSMLDYVKLPITYPISIRDYINAISTVLGLKFANKSETFANYNKQIQADLYDGLGYTFRDILDELAQVTASTICLNNNDELEIRYITETGDTIDEEFLKDVNVNFGEKFGAVNTIVLSRSGDSDSVYYPSVLPANPYEIKISDNQIMNGNDRADFLPDIYNKLNGLEFYTNDFVSTGICYYDLCDRYSVKVGDNTYSCVMFNDEVLVTQGLEENVYTELPEQTETDYKHASKDDRMINQVYIIAKKNEAEILAVVNTTEQLQKEINPIKNESGSEIIIEDASNNPLTYLEIEGKSTQTTRSGKNLLNVPSSFTIDNYYTEVSFSVNSGTYVLSFNSIDSNNPQENFLIRLVYTDNTDDYYYVNNSYKTITITVEKDVSAIFFYAGDNYTNSAGITTTYNNLMISIEGGEYEPYGASPSPDYPSEIKSVGYENLWSLDSSYTTETGSEYVLRDTPIPTIPAGDYILSLKKSANIKVLFYFKDSSNNGVEVYLDGTDKQLMTFTKDITTAVIYIYGTSPCTISDIQITKGTKKHSYIPYGKYGIEVETIGKNLFNIHDVEWGKYNVYNNEAGNYSNAFISYVSVKPNTIYSLSALSSNTFRFSYQFLDTNGRVLSGFYNSYTETSHTFENLLSPSSATKILISQLDVSQDDDIKVQLEENKISTEIEEYKSNTSTILLDAPLRSLPNGVKDIAYIRNNKLHVDRYVGSRIFDGSEEWKIYNDYTNTNYSTFYLKIADGENSKPINCSHFIVKAGDYTQLLGKEECCYSGASGGTLGVYISIRSTIASTLDAFKTWLSTHNTQVDYELATPVTEELGEIEMLKTLKGYNNISTTDKLLPIINLTYVRDTILADYVENHVAELKLTENEIKASVESVSSSVDGLNTTINRVEEITNDNSQVINVISTSSSFDLTTGEVREVTTTNGFKFDSKGLNIYTDENSYNTQIDNVGTYYKDGNEVISQTTKDGSLLKNLKMQGQTQYSFDGDSYDFIEERVEIDGEYCYATFYNGEE